MVVVTEVFQGKVFTVVQVRDEDTGRIAEGVAKMSPTDPFDKDIGRVIAEGRARKALAKKLVGKWVTLPYMG